MDAKVIVEVMKVIVASCLRDAKVSRSLKSASVLGDAKVVAMFMTFASVLEDAKIIS